MNIIKSITIATVMALVSGFANAGVGQYGRGTPTIGAGVTVSTSSYVDVQNVQGRSSIVSDVSAVKSDLTAVARAASDVQGRS